MSRFISCLHLGVTKPYLSLRLIQNASSFLKPFLDHTSWIKKIQQIRFSRVLSLWDANSQIRLIIIGFLIRIYGVFTNAFSTLIRTVSHLKWAGGNSISPSDYIIWSWNPNSWQCIFWNRHPREEAWGTRLRFSHDTPCTAVHELAWPFSLLLEH